MNLIRNINEITGIRSTTDLTNNEIKTIASFVITNEHRKLNSICQYLEIGVLAGATIRFCKQYTKTTHFIGVDLFEDFQMDVNNTHTSGTFKRDDIQKLTGARTHLIKGNSHTVLPELIKQGAKFDFILIDGDHAYQATKEDFEHAQQLLADEGQIAFHNCSTHMGPDFELYITKDGGPFRLMQEIINSGKWNLVADIDRVKVFTKKI